MDGTEDDILWQDDEDGADGNEQLPEDNSELLYADQNEMAAPKIERLPTGSLFKITRTPKDASDAVMTFHRFKRTVADIKRKMDMVRQQWYPITTDKHFYCMEKNGYSWKTSVFLERINKCYFPSSGVFEE